MSKTKEGRGSGLGGFLAKLPDEECYLSINETTINFTHLQTEISLQITFKVCDSS